MASNHKFVVRQEVSDATAPVVVAAGGHTHFVLCSECLAMADPLSGLVYRQDGTRMSLDCPRATLGASAPPGSISPEVLLQVLRAARIPNQIEAEQEKGNVPMMLGDVSLRPETGRPPVSREIEEMVLIFVRLGVAVASSMQEALLARPQRAQDPIPVRLDKVMSSTAGEIDSGPAFPMAQTTPLGVSVVDGPFAAASASRKSKSASAPAGAAGGGGGGGGGGGAAGPLSPASASVSASAGGGSDGAGQSTDGPPGGGPAASPRVRPPPPGAVTVPMSAAMALLIRIVSTALGLIGINMHSALAHRLWAAAATAAFTAAPDGSLVPVGLFWARVRACVDNDKAIRLQALLRVPPTSADAALAPIVSVKPIVAHGASASLLQWAPRLGVLMAASRDTTARALLAATWREWQEALVAAGAAAKKEQKALGITPSTGKLCPRCDSYHSGDCDGKKRRRDDDGKDRGAGGGDAVT